jgi:hypothetical protein
VARTLILERTQAPVVLNTLLGQGGEGAVWSTSINGFAAKVYHRPTSPQTVAKLRAMLATPPQDPTRVTLGHVSIAWPVELLFDNSDCVGFLMPAIKSSLTLSTLVIPRLRKQRAAGFNAHYMIQAADNTTRAFENIHKEGHVIGDANSLNLLLSDRALVSLIDTDSFQITDGSTVYRCLVGTPEFTPSELYGTPFAQIDRSEEHDRFGLGVLIFLLVYGGIHPFSGVWKRGNPPEIGELICQGQYVYAPRSRLKPGPLHLPEDLVHPDVKTLFRRCFIDGHSNPLNRPSAAEWRIALENALTEIIPCKRSNQHFYGSHLKRCPWCARFRKLNVDIFPPLSGAGSSPSPYLDQLLNALQRGDERTVALLYTKHRTLHREARLSGKQQQIAQCIQVMVAFDAFVTAHKRNPQDTAALLRLWVPELANSNVVRKEKINGRTVLSIANALRQPATVTPPRIPASPPAIRLPPPSSPRTRSAPLPLPSGSGRRIRWARLVPVLVVMVMLINSFLSGLLHQFRTRGNDSSSSEDSVPWQVRPNERRGRSHVWASPSSPNASVPNAAPVKGTVDATPSPAPHSDTEQPVSVEDLPASLRVRVYPWSEVFIDDERVSSETPAMLNLSSGQHRITLIHPTLGSLTQDFIVNGGKHYDVYGRFQRGEILLLQITEGTLWEDPHGKESR